MHATPASEAGVVALLAAVVVALLMLVSADSYLHDLFDHVDSAWYYICGKAWMNGMTPYVDFADSKGPMLWLIYGVGYLLSPRDYTGVFWLTCLSYAITYWLNYRTAWQLTGSRRWGIVVSLLMSLGYFYPMLHEEIKSEDFAQLWVALALFATCRLALGDRKQLKPMMIALGISMAMTLMIKYSFTAMLSIFAIYSLIIVWRRRYGIAAAMGWGIAGAAIVLVPWAIYMLAVGIFDDFVQEYAADDEALLDDGCAERRHGRLFGHAGQTHPSQVAQGAAGDAGGERAGRHVGAATPALAAAGEHRVVLCPHHIQCLVALLLCD